MKKLAIVAAAVVLVGCGSNGLRFKEVPEGNATAASLDEAGSVHVSVISVMPWADVREKLRPKLMADEATARAQAVPITFAMLDRYLDILRLRASITPNTVKTTEMTTFKSATGQEDSETVDRTTTKAPGTPRDTAVPDPLAAGSKAGDLAAAASGINSSLSARAVASYIQEIQALNSEVDHAAQRTNMDPYLMRVQVSVMPLRRHLGYDVYSNLSFFAYSEAGSTRTPAEYAPFVVPLLSSDSIETAQRNQNIEAIRDIGIALDLIKGFGSVGAGFGSQRDRQQALAGLDVNSVMTMGRLADNTLRVRFGAANDAGGGYVTHPRTNTISVLVYLPRTANKMRVVSRQNWVHAVDGTPLERNQVAYYKRLDDIADGSKELGVSSKRLQLLDEYALTGNFKAFDTELRNDYQAWCSKLPTEPERRKFVEDSCPKERIAAHDLELERKVSYIWSQLLSLLPGSRLSTTVLDIPQLRPVCPPGVQLAAYQEDDSGVTVTLLGGRDLSKDKLRAVLHLGKQPALTPAAASAPAKQQKRPAAAAAAPAAAAPTAAAQPAEYVGALMASSVDVGATRNQAKMAFSTKGLEAMPWSAGAMQPLAVELSGCAPNAPATSQPSAPYALVQRAFAAEADSQVYLLRARLAKEEKPKDKFTVTLAARSPSVVADKNNAGSIDIVVDMDKEDAATYAVGVTGADLKSVTPVESVQARGDGTWQIKQAGRLTLALANLVPNQSLDLEVRSVDKSNKTGGAVRKQPVLVRKN